MGGPLEKEIPDLETTFFGGELLVLGSVQCKFTEKDYIFRWDDF